MEFVSEFNWCFNDRFRWYFGDRLICIAIEMIGIVDVCGISFIISEIGCTGCMPIWCKRSIIYFVQRECTATEQWPRLTNLIGNLWIDRQICHTTIPCLIISITFTMAKLWEQRDREPCEIWWKLWYDDRRLTIHSGCN